MQSPTSLSSPSARAWSVFAVVFALMVFDYVDRQVVVAMFPHLKAEWGLSDAELGALVSIVSITVAAGALPLSLLADRWSRVKAIFAMALVWSFATIACAYARGYGELLAARSVVGLGEAAYGAAGAALLSTLFPARMRSSVLGAFIAAALVGSVVGVVAGGAIAERWGWRSGFGVVGVPGLLLAVVFVLVARENATGSISLENRVHRLGVGAIARELLRPRTVLVACVGSGLHLLTVSAAWTWLPAYFNRYYGLPPDQAALRAGLVVLAGGIGAVLWSVLADRLSRRVAGARLYVAAGATLTTAMTLCVAFAIIPAGAAQIALIFAGAVVMTGSVGPIAAVVVDVVHPGARATVSALLALTQNLFGLAAGPLVGGLLSDRYGLSFALSIVPLFSALAAAVFIYASRTYAFDLERAGHTDTVHEPRAAPSHG